MPPLRSGAYFVGWRGGVNDTLQLNGTAEPTTFYWVKYFRATCLPQRHRLSKAAPPALATGSRSLSGWKSESADSLRLVGLSRLGPKLDAKAQLLTHAGLGVLNGNGWLGPNILFMRNPTRAVLGSGAVAALRPPRSAWAGHRTDNGLPAAILESAPSGPTLGQVQPLGQPPRRPTTL